MWKSLKNHIANKAMGMAMGHISGASSGALGKLGKLGSAFAAGANPKDAGKVAARLLKKGPFDIPDSPSAKLRENPLQFSPVQYPLDLGTNELGHYILFESGFVGYSAQTSTFDTYVETVPIKGNPHSDSIKVVKPFKVEKLTAKTPSHSITTSGIALYMPPSAKASYKQTYDADTTGMAGDIEVGWKGVKSAQSAADKIEAGLRGVISPGLRQAKKMLGEFISLAGAGDPVRFAAKRAGVAMNPRNEMFYDSPEMRNFDFTFDFWPRNPKEAEAVEKIISIFKYNSSPGFQDGTLGGVFTIPNYWKISYMHNSARNSKLNRIGACYCTGVDVNYAPDGQWTTTEDGTPVHTELKVTFVEDRIITKRDIEAGA